MIDPDWRTAPASKDMQLIMEAYKKLMLCSLELFSLLELCYCYVSKVCVFVSVGLKVCASLHFPYLPTPPMTAHQLCRHSDSTGALLVQLLSSS